MGILILIFKDVLLILGHFLLLLPINLCYSLNNHLEKYELFLPLFVLNFLVISLLLNFSIKLNKIKILSY